MRLSQVVPDGLRSCRGNTKKVHHNLRVRGTTVLKTSSPNDHRDTFRNTERATYQVSLGLKKKKGHSFADVNKKRAGSWLCYP